MRLKINASNLFTHHYLMVHPEGVRFCEAILGGGVKRFRFDQIVCVLMTPESVLCFQVGEQIFKIPVKPSNKTHQATLDALLAGVQEAAGIAG